VPSSPFTMLVRLSALSFLFSAGVSASSPVESIFLLTAKTSDHLFPRPKTPFFFILLTQWGILRPMEHAFVLPLRMVLPPRAPPGGGTAFPSPPLLKEDLSPSLSIVIFLIDLGFDSTPEFFLFRSTFPFPPLGEHKRPFSPPTPRRI